MSVKFLVIPLTVAAALATLGVSIVVQDALPGRAGVPEELRHFKGKSSFYGVTIGNSCSWVANAGPCVLNSPCTSCLTNPPDTWASWLTGSGYTNSPNVQCGNSGQEYSGTCSGNGDPAIFCANPVVVLNPLGLCNVRNAVLQAPPSGP